MQNIIFLGLVSFFTDLSTEMVYPLIPLYLASLGAAPILMGLIEGVSESLASLLKVFSGYFTDKTQRKKELAFWGYASSLFYKIALIFSTTWGGILVARVIDKIGKGIRTSPRDVLISESVDKSNMGRAFGIHKALDELGSALGILITFFILVMFMNSSLNDIENSEVGDDLSTKFSESLIDIDNHEAREDLPIQLYENVISIESQKTEEDLSMLKKLFAYSMIPAVLGLVMFIFIKQKKMVREVTKREPFWKDIKKLDSQLKLYLLVVLFFGLGNSSKAFFILKARNDGFQDANIILLYFIFCLVAGILSVPFGKLSDRIGRKKLLVPAYFTFSICYLGFAFSTNWQSMTMMYVLYGVYTAMIAGAERAFITEVAPGHLKGTMLGLHATITGLALLPASLIAGGLWTYFDKVQKPYIIGAQMPFIFGAGMSMIAAVVLVIFMKNKVAIKPAVVQVG
jgi:MFS family permease